MWFEFRVAVRGMSLNIPALQRIQPRFTIMRNIYNNVVHSNDVTGVTTYPPGMEPFKSGQRNRNTIYGMVVFKNVRLGALVHDSFDVNMTGATFADNAVAIKISQDAGNILADSRVISLTDNYGNPSGCSGTLTNVNCRPAVTSSPYSCTMPLKAGIPGRSVHGISRLSPQFGVVLDQNKRSNGPVPHQLINVRFSNFDDTCWNAAAIMVAPWNPNFWDAADSVQGLEFTDNTKPIYFPSSSKDPVYAFLGLTTGGELNRYLALYDQDGSIIGSPGYVVANNPPLLPPNKAGCTLQSDWNAYACPGTCYRSVQISYPEPGFVSSTSNSRTLYSFLRVTRVSDGAVLELDGNLNQTFPYEPTYRYFFFTLLAGQTYRVEAIPPPNSTFSPTIIKMQYLDVNVCNGAVTLQFKQAANQPWVTSSTNTVFYEQCPSGTPLPPDSPYATYAPVCFSYSPWVEVVMFPNFIDSVPLSQGIGTDGGICQSTNQCSLLWSGANGWLYDDSGLDRHPSFFNPTLLYPSYWKTGLAPLGWYPPTKFVATTIHMPDRYHVTYYYRQSFNVLNTAALTALQIDGVLEDGAAIYLNGNQIVQFNLPNATLTNRTLGLSNLPLAYWRTFTLPLTGVSSLFLVEGTNVVAVEQHVYTMAPSPLSFDLRLSAISL